MIKITSCETLHFKCQVLVYFRILHARYKSLRRVVFDDVHRLLIDIQPMNPRIQCTAHHTKCDMH